MLNSRYSVLFYQTLYMFPILPCTSIHSETPVIHSSLLEKPWECPVRVLTSSCSLESRFFTPTVLTIVPVFFFDLYFQDILGQIPVSMSDPDELLRTHLNRQQPGIVHIHGRYRVGTSLASGTSSEPF